MQISGAFLEQIAGLKTSAGQGAEGLQGLMGKGLQGLFASLLNGSLQGEKGVPEDVAGLLEGRMAGLNREGDLEGLLPGLSPFGKQSGDVGLAGFEDLASRLRQLVDDMQKMMTELFADGEFSQANFEGMSASAQEKIFQSVTIVQEITVTAVAIQVEQQPLDDMPQSIDDLQRLMQEAGLTKDESVQATADMAMLLQYTQQAMTQGHAATPEATLNRLLEGARAGASQTSFTLVMQQRSQVQFQVSAQAMQQAQFTAPVKDVGLQAELGQPLLPASSQMMSGSLTETMSMNAMMNAQAAGRVVSGMQPVEDEALPLPMNKRGGKDDAGFKVADKQPIETLIQLRGQEIFRWQQSSTGMDVMQQMKDMQAILAQAGYNNSGGGDGSDMAVQDGDIGTSARGSSFAERVMQFAKAANVGLQAKPMMQTLAQNGGGTVRVQLHPAELGSIQIELEVREGTVRGRIAAENIEVVEHLARDVHHLKQGLADAGYELGEEGISFMLSDENPQGETQDNQPGTPQAEQDSELVAEENAADWVDPDQLVDVKV